MYGLQKRRYPVSEDQLREIKRLLDGIEETLTDRTGSALDPVVTIDRLTRVLRPRHAPLIAQIPWKNWADPKTPTRALGLTHNLRERLRLNGITTVGELTAHSVSGLQTTGGSTSSTISVGQVKTIRIQLAERKLSLAKNNTAVPLQVFFSRKRRLFADSLRPAVFALAQRHDLSTLGDLSRLSYAAIKALDCFPREWADLTKSEKARQFAEELNRVLRAYRLGTIKIS